SGPKCPGGGRWGEMLPPGTYRLACRCPRRSRRIGSIGSRSSRLLNRQRDVETPGPSEPYTLSRFETLPYGPPNDFAPTLPERSTTMSVQGSEHPNGQALKLPNSRRCRPMASHRPYPVTELKIPVSGVQFSPVHHFSSVVTVLASD